MRVAALVFLAAALAACGDDLHPPVHAVDGHGLHVTITEDPARIEIVRISDGAVIFDGLAGGAAGTAAPPQVAAAFRDATPSIEQQSGSYKIEDDKKAPWTGVATFDDVAIDGDTVTLGMAGPGGARVGVATIAIGDVAGATAGAGAEVTLHLDFTPSGAANRASIAYACDPAEHFLGMGGQAWDVDHRGRTVPVWVEEDGVTKRADDSYDGIWFLTGRRHSTHLPVPVFLSTRGYAAALDTDARSVFAFGSEPDASSDVVRIEAWEPTLDLHLFVGEPDAADLAAAPRRALDLMTAWVGRPELPSDVVFAPWLDALHGDANVRRVAQALRDADVATSVIWTEDWRGGEASVGGYQLLENWRVDRTLYPDLEGTAAALHGEGFKFLTYNNTFLETRADVYPEAVAHDYEIHHADGTEYQFDGNTFMPETLLDLWNPAAVAWAKAIFREGLAQGADGWMADFGEWLPTDARLADGSDPMRRHNRYTVEWAKLNHDLQVERGGDLLFFMRSAYLHSQPLVQVVWPGDQQTDWTLGDGFPSVIPPGIGLGVAGFPYYAHDIGGYMSELTVPTTKELWFRWCELGALTPVMRTHHGRDADHNWNWESDAETTALLRRYSKLHMQLVPYLAARADEARATGLPVLRPIGLDYDADGWDWVWTSTDEYLLGDRILVAPVVQEGAVTRDVALPAGRWYPLAGGAAVEGGQTITVAAPVTEIPAFVPAGAILVEYPDTVDTVVAAPDDPSLVTAADVGDDRDVVVFAGAAPRPEVATHALRGATYTWSGRDVAAAAPASATFDGQPVAVTATADGVTVTVTGPGTLVFDGGGTLALAGAIGETTVSLRR